MTVCTARRSEARVDDLLRPADLAFDFAAPVEGARAPLDHLLDLRLVAAAAAHQIAAVDADRRLVAHAALRAGDAQFQVLLAEVGRVLVVDEVLLGRGLVLGVVRLQLVVVLLAPVARRAARVADEHARRPVEAVLEVVADLPEVRQAHPARADRARSAHAVALALLPHLARDVLQNKEKRIFNKLAIEAHKMEMPGISIQSKQGGGKIF